MQAMSALVALQYLNLTGCGRVQGDALTALASLTALRQVHYAGYSTLFGYEKLHTIMISCL